MPPTSPLFIQARTALARIYLDKRRDRAAYTKCYQDIIDRFRDKRSYMLFGEAMVHIQEPLKAVEALKEALRRVRAAMRYGGRWTQIVKPHCDEVL